MLNYYIKQSIRTLIYSVRMLCFIAIQSYFLLSCALVISSKRFWKADFETGFF
jgi:hypothetical protein